MKNVNVRINQEKDFNRIVLPVDGSDGSKRAAKRAFALAKETGVDVLAMYVVDDHGPVYPDPAYPDLVPWYPLMIESTKKYGISILDEVKKIGLKAGVHVITKIVDGHPDQEIIKEARKNDLIVMGCKGQSALSSIFVGSVCEKVFRHSSSPVMVVR